MEEYSQKVEGLKVKGVSDVGLDIYNGSIKMTNPGTTEKC